MRTHTPRSARTRGQALIEMGIVVVLLTFLAMGIVEVGYAFARTNMIVHAARDGARFGATLDQRDNTTGCLTGAGTSTIHTHVQNALSAIGFTANTIGVSQGCTGTVPTITVTVSGPLHLLFDLLPGGTQVNVNRTVTFEDEARICNGGGGC